MALALNLSGESAPERLQVLPVGPQIVGHDGRSWRVDDQAALVAALNAVTVDRPIDINHSTEIKAPKGEDSPAVGWLKAGTFAVAANGAIEAAVEWTEAGRNAVLGRAYRYLSPALIYERTTGKVAGLSSVGLVPRPNLHALPALNAPSNSTEDPMNETQFKALCLALGIAEDSNAETAINSAKKLKADHGTALNAAQTPDPAKFIRKADYDLALNRAKDAEAKLAEQAKTSLETAVNAMLDQAIKDGKVAPASRDSLLAIGLNGEDGKKQLETYLGSVGFTLSKQTAPNGAPDEQAKALNSVERAVASQMGITEEELKSSVS